MRKGLIRKAHLAHNMKKWAAKHPNGALAAAVPETYILSVDDEEYIDEALCDLPEVRPDSGSLPISCAMLTAADHVPLNIGGSCSSLSSGHMRWLGVGINTSMIELLQVRDMEPGSAVWIVKPSITNQGAGIAMIDSCAGLRSVLEGGDDTTLPLEQCTIPQMAAATSAVDIVRTQDHAM
jgi:hypothetical protein